MSEHVRGRGIRLNTSHSSWTALWDHVHRVLVVNAGLALTNLPLLLALQIERRPWQHPVLFTVLVAAAGPSLTAAFGYLRLADDEDRPRMREFFRAYRRLARRGLALWTPLVVLAAVCTADAVFLRHRSGLAPALLPLHAVLVLVAAGTGLTATAFAADPSDRRARTTLLAAAYGLLLRPAPAAVNLLLAAVCLVVVSQVPLYGLAVAPGCALFVIWRNSRPMEAAVHRARTRDHPT
ncbi:YesL family protein [Kitasatospora phosalacinea]|uniref:YesL family protein n=1 Tax=Kitasatospora phosalacinea TaxID=2065 RepID=UPI00068C63A8|nr:YesL family protein [Kitasatospora phosalacinea]